MKHVLGTAIFLTMPAVFLGWQLAVVAILRLFGLVLPFSFPFNLSTRRERELRTALKGRGVGVHVLIDGLLLTSCPVIAALTTFDYLSDRYVFDLPYNLRSFYIALLAIAVVLGSKANPVAPDRRPAASAGGGVTV